jgi:hypothetical protein
VIGIIRNDSFDENEINSSRIIIHTKQNYLISGIMTYFIALWNGCLIDHEMEPVNLDKLIGVAKRAFNHAAKERPRKMVYPPRSRTPLASPTLRLDTPGPEFYVWNEFHPTLPKTNAADPWYMNFYDTHTEVDVFTQKAALILKVNQL